MIGAVGGAAVVEGPLGELLRAAVREELREEGG
jgi:hypothetical protein